MLRTSSSVPAMGAETEGRPHGQTTNSRIPMATIDWIIVLLYFIGSAVVGILYARRAGGSMQEFFLSGRNLPWWLAGTSMVATTFAADTPLAVTELVAKNGIAGHWLWGNVVLGGARTVFSLS